MAKESRKHKVLGIPVLGCILLMIWGLLLYQLPSAIIGNFNAPIIAAVVSAIFAFLALGIHKCWFKPEYKGSFSNIWFKDKDILIGFFAVVAVDIVLWITKIAKSGIDFSVNAVFMAITAGAGEEMALRALPISILMRDYMSEKKIAFCAWFPSVLFGVFHFSNMLSGAKLDVTIIQVVGATCLGLLLAALYLRTGNILIPMLYHALHDFMEFIIADATNANGIITIELTTPVVVKEVIIDVVALAAGIFLIRKSVRPKIMEIWKDRWNRQ